ncbi:MAG: GNAT family N-acetyltransferase [Saprospiraceae bacterium]|nr:GNAT family N-acetyltransferase [Saprospiraceae bacterium]
MPELRKIFRLAKPRDLHQLNRISYASKSFWDYPEEWLNKWKSDLEVSQRDIEEQNILVAIIEDRIIGFCQIKEEINKFEINHLWILPRHMGQGIGRELLNAAIDTLTSGTKQIEVLADPNAEAFYQKQGFVTFSKVESYPKGRYLPLMRKQ